MVLVPMLRFVQHTILCSMMVTAADFRAVPTEGREAADQPAATGRKMASPDSLRSTQSSAICMANPINETMLVAGHRRGGLASEGGMPIDNALKHPLPSVVCVIGVILRIGENGSPSEFQTNSLKTEGMLVPGYGRSGRCPQTEWLPKEVVAKKRWNLHCSYGK
jgi:hypothetical protein